MLERRGREEDGVDRQPDERAAGVSNSWMTRNRSGLKPDTTSTPDKADTTTTRQSGHYNDVGMRAMIQPTVGRAKFGRFSSRFR